MIYLWKIFLVAGLLAMISIVFDFKIDSFQRRLADAEKEIKEIKDRTVELPKKENGDKL